MGPSTPFFRTEDTETASVGAIMAEKSAACCHIQPVCLRSKTYSRIGVMSAVEAITMRNAKVSTWPSICSRCQQINIPVQLGVRTEGRSLALQPECHFLRWCLALLDVCWVRRAFRTCLGTCQSKGGQDSARCSTLHISARRACIGLDTHQGPIKGMWQAQVISNAVCNDTLVFRTNTTLTCV